METLEAIFSRRSIRKYKDKPVDSEKVKVILKAGMYAPSAANRQPWGFIVVNKKSILRKVIEFHPYANMLEEASLAIVVCGDTKKQLSTGYWPVDCAASTQNILLAAHGLGLGAVWVGIYPREERMNATAALFNLPSSVIPFSIIAVGHPNEEKKDPDRFDEKNIHYNSWH